MSLFGDIKISRRVRKIWLSAGAVLVLTGLLAGGILWFEAARDTDLTDPTLNVTATSTEETDSDVPAFAFTDVAKELGVTMRHGPGPRTRSLIEDTGSGLAWGDFDGDGDFDLYCVNMPGPEGGEQAGNRLFRNDGDRFADVTESAGVADAQAHGMGASVVDYDADGDADLYVTNFGANRLYRNRGDGTFEEVAAQAGIDGAQWSTGATWGDFNRDGHVDVYVCNYVDYDAVDFDTSSMSSAMGSFGVPFTLNPNSFDPVPNHLYRNRGDGTFEEVAQALGVDDPKGRSLCATFCDLDGDSWLDLYVNNDVSTNRLYRNMLGEADTDDTGEPVPFADRSAMTGTADARGSMGLSVGEIGAMVDRLDGLPDLFITHWVAQENALYQSVAEEDSPVLYLDKTRQFRLGEISLDAVGWGSVFADFDRDGRIDIAVANGSTLEKKDDPKLLRPEKLFLLWNTGARYQNAASHAGEAFDRQYSGRGLAAADFDDDGDVDLAVCINRGAPLLLRNDTQTDNGFLKVRLDAPAAVACGARIELTLASDDDETSTHFRWWNSDASFMSGHAPEALFGIPHSWHVRRIQVTWADGTHSTLDAPEGQRVRVEHDGAN